MHRQFQSLLALLLQYSKLLAGLVAPFSDRRSSPAQPTAFSGLSSRLQVKLERPEYKGLIYGSLSGQNAVQGCHNAARHDLQGSGQQINACWPQTELNNHA